MLKTVTKGGGLINYSYFKYKALYRLEDLGYMGAFLVQLRQALALNKISPLKMSDEQEREISLNLYDEVNQLYTEEHWCMVSADLLEQSYGMFSALHKICQNKKVVWRKENYKTPKNLDPNQFPIFPMIKKFDGLGTLWEQNQGDYMRQLLRQVGHSLEIKKSTIDHPSAGNGVFLRCNKFVLPGTLLGFFPGIIIDPSMRLQNNLSPNSEYPFLERSDELRIQFESVMLPYPVCPGLSLEEYQQKMEEEIKDTGNEDKYFFAPPQYINPFALGHKINHSPNEQPPNSLLLDFIIPYTFFPDFYLQYLPYIEALSQSTESKHFKQPGYRTVAVVANRAIADGEELFLDYVYDQRAPLEYTPDWLIEPEDRNPLLHKRLYAYQPPALFNFIHKYKLLKLGPAFEEYYTRVAIKQRSTPTLSDIKQATLLVGNNSRKLLKA